MAKRMAKKPVPLRRRLDFEASSLEELATCS